MRRAGHPPQPLGPTQGHPHQEAAQDQRSAADPQVATGELLRRLARGVLDAPDPADAVNRLRAAAEAAGRLVTGRHVDRVTAATLLSLAAQAAGVGQSTAFAIIHAAFYRRAAR